MLALATGALVFLKIPGLDQLTRASYTVFDIALAVLVVAAIVTVLRGTARQFRNGATDH